ncbi:uncharacterized protein LOC121864510 isoform X2 [Homarus americanus]|uniref:uncharacterized protein LOC121864510 isoform X2 n=1 Tax=Homarus americanus TaxID=6706 RepID=UPI001C496C4B|nr:uncharacterized protein LOC121864510 isoform X2 [Homarus americanus]
MLNILARQTWRQPVLCSSKVLMATRTLAGEQQARVRPSNLGPQEKTKTSHYLRSWYSIIYHHYNDTTSQPEAKLFISYFPKIKTVLKPIFDEVLTILQCQGYSWEEVKEYRGVLLLSPSQLRRRLQIFHDFSIDRPTLHQVFYVSEFLDCNTSVLRVNGVYSQGYDILPHLLDSVKDLSLPQHILDQFDSQFDDTVPLKDIYLYLLKHYLAQRFSRDIDDIEMLFDKVGLPTWKSLAAYVHICDIIINSLGLDFETIQANPLLLNLEPEEVKKVLERYPNIGKSSTVDIIKEFPNFLFIPFLKIDLWLTLLHRYKEFTVDEYTLRLFKSTAFKDVEKRLQVLMELPEWKVICMSEKLLRILRDSKSVKELLNAAEAGSLVTIASAIQETGVKTKFHRIQRVSSELILYVAQELDVEKHEARELLQEDFQLQYGIANVKMVLQLLFDFGFTREQIINGILVLNFEYGVVEQGLREFPSRTEAQPFHEWMENPFVLQLLAYCIKKDVPHLEFPFRR